MRVKLQLYTTIVCMLGILLGAACKTWFPQYWFGWYTVILLVFWLMEMIMSFILEKNEKNMTETSLAGKKFMKTYMIAKFIKLFITLALIATYLAVMKDKPDGHQTEFAGCAVAFYLINLGIETAVVTKKSKK